MNSFGGFIRALLRPLFRGAACLYVSFFLFFFVIAVVTMLLGYELGDVDRWLDSQSGWIAAVGDLLFRSLCAFILLCCAAIIGIGLWNRFSPAARQTRPGPGVEDKPIGWGTMIGALVVGYFVYFGVVY